MDRSTSLLHLIYCNLCVTILDHIISLMVQDLSLYIDDMELQTITQSIYLTTHKKSRCVSVAHSQYGTIRYVEILTKLSNL